MDRGRKAKMFTVKIVEIRPAELETDTLCQALSTAHKCIGKNY